eukprot:353643-Chlamydomonas_euryale.AAC.4
MHPPPTRPPPSSVTIPAARATTAYLESILGFGPASRLGDVRRAVVVHGRGVQRWRAGEERCLQEPACCRWLALGLVSSHDARTQGACAQRCSVTGSNVAVHGKCARARASRAGRGPIGALGQTSASPQNERRKKRARSQNNRFRRASRPPKSIERRGRDMPHA